MKNLRTIRRITLFLASLLIAGQVGYFLGQRQIKLAITPTKKIVINSAPPQNNQVDFSLFWDVWQRLDSRYIDKTKLDVEKMVYGAISGMVNALDDPYTVFLTPKENNDYKQDLNGAFEGIGAQLGAKDDKVVVVAPLKDHPAEKAGLKAGDWIAKIDGADTFGMTVLQAVAKIRGPKGSQVTLTIMREGVEKSWDVKIIRDTIIVKSVEWEAKLIDPLCQENCTKAAYVKLSRFGDRTNDEWNEIVSEIRNRMRDEQIEGLILDLRNNPGGYLQSAIYVSSEFVKQGVIVIQENSDGTRETHSVSRVGNLLDIPLVVLINKGSASAAEILAGALRDYDRGTLIGESTFGKGSIQTPEDLPGGAGLHITTARWILPKGEWINGTGITPDLEIKVEAATDTADLQLDRALEEFTE